MKIVPRVRFSLFESLLLLANITVGSYMTRLCEGIPLSSVAVVASSLNVFRLIRRIPNLRMSWLVVIKSYVLIFLNLVLFLLFLGMMAMVMYSIFSERLMACQLTTNTGITDQTVHCSHQTCEKNHGIWTSPSLNFNSFYFGMATGYFHIQNSEWNTLLRLSLAQFDGWLPYLLFEFVAVLFAVAILNILLRGYTIAVCYINLGSLSIVNTDPMITLSKAQLEWIQIEEQLAYLDLLKRDEKVTSRIGILSKKLNSSRYVKIFYYSVIILAFILNLAP